MTTALHTSTKLLNYWAPISSRLGDCSPICIDPGQLSLLPSVGWEWVLARRQRQCCLDGKVTVCQTVVCSPAGLVA